MFGSETSLTVPSEEVELELPERQDIPMHDLLQRLVARCKPATDDRAALEQERETVELLGLYVLLRSFYAGELGAGR